MARTYKTAFAYFTNNGSYRGKQSGIMFVNQSPIVGGSNVNINGYNLPPQQYISINAPTGVPDAIDDTLYKINFEPGGINKLLVTTITFTDIK